jgi:2-aminoadipate transaminase
MMRLAERTHGVMPSAVREILKVAEQPNIRSFAGGLPAPELFPVRAIADAHDRVLSKSGAAALQYSTSEGFGPLRDWVAHRFGERGAPTSADEVLITNGSQQGIDLVARVLLDPGAVVVTENPTYLAALQVFQAAQAKVIAVDSDPEGMVLEALAKVLATHDVRLIYVVPTFANPTGVTWSHARRAGLMALAQAWNVPVLEDDPYEAIRFSGAVVAPLAAMDGAGLVISLGTFSKMLAPGLRVGWLKSPPSLRRHLLVAKQATDLHSSSLAQRAVAELLETFDLEVHLARLRVEYGARCSMMAKETVTHFPSGTVVNRPDGGLFLWVELPLGVDTLALLTTAVTEHRVAYVPGAPFFADRARTNTLRLTFSNCQPADIVDGIARLGSLFSSAIETRASLVL